MRDTKMPSPDSSPQDAVASEQAQRQEEAVASVTMTQPVVRAATVVTPAAAPRPSIPLDILDMVGENVGCVAEPPPVEAHVTEEPQFVELAATELPATEPSTTDLATELAATEPAVTEPFVTEPPAVESPTRGLKRAAEDDDLNPPMEDDFKTPM